MINKSIFNNVHQEEDLKHWHGKEINLLSVIANPKDPKSSPDAMPLFEAQLSETGEIAGIQYEEVPEKDWPEELKATLNGMKAYREGDDSQFNYSGELANYFEYGKQLAEYKD